MAKSDINLTSLISKSVGALVALILLIWVVSGSMTTVGADEIVVKQDVIDGQLRVWNTPGVHWQMFGTIVRYKRSAQLWFSAKEDEGKKTDDSIRVRFNDGGHGNISGSLRYTLPIDPNKMIALHQSYHSMEAIDHELIRQVVNKSVYMSGPLMSSRESSSTGRADLIKYITDQIEYGVYRTEHVQTKTTDALTGQEKTVDIVVPKNNPTAPDGIDREEASPIQAFGLTATNITINGIEYDAVVEEQIKQQQQAIMAVQQAIVNAKKAEQDTLTVEQQGKAEAAKARWAQEVEKATAVTSAEKDKAVAVTQAEKDRDVAALALETAKLAAQQTVTSAKADADAKKLAVQANNNFQDRIGAYVAVNQAWATAYGAQRQTPDIALGGGGNSGLATAMDMVAIKAARDLQVQAKP